eukprot:TRINITY_DN11187_c0_g1_i1.p1 TRINITY_DN11187_c0_g1~~TRINITY_DN11187_c0_g1_i1.p1  ORF type:complete len:554 (-),score=90.72 TRINITY_DN11187_c0_g1_i1:413-2074(-)
MGNTATVPERLPALPPDDFLQTAREPLLDLLDRFDEDEQQQKLLPLGEEAVKSIALDRSRSSSSWTGGGFLSRPSKPAWSSRRATFYKGSVPTSLLHKQASTNGGEPNAGENSNDDGKTTVVIKRLRLGQERGGRDCYWNEVRLLTEVSGHPNVLQLLGCCAERGEALLIYEYMVRGSLYDALFEVPRKVSDSRFQGKTPVLPFANRMRIALDTARGLQALHDKNIIHLDVRPGNVLLDEGFHAKVAGLGAARMLAPAELGAKALQGDLHQHRIIGRIGYICPSYLETGQISPKTDLFAFGVVLLQLLCGRTLLPRDETGEAVSIIEIASRPEIGVVPEDVLRRKEKSAELSKQEFERSVILRRQLDLLREEMEQARQESGYVAPKPTSGSPSTLAGGNAPKEAAFGKAQIDTGNVNNNSEVSDKVNRKGYARLEQPPSSEPSTPGGLPGATGYARLELPSSSETSTPSGPPNDSFASPSNGRGNGDRLERGAIELVRSFEAFMDPRLEGKYEEKVAREAAALAIRCVQETPGARPKTAEVVEMMKAIVEQIS